MDKMMLTFLKVKKMAIVHYYYFYSYYAIRMNTVWAKLFTSITISLITLYK